VKSERKNRGVSTARNVHKSDLPPGDKKQMKTKGSIEWRSGRLYGNALNKRTGEYEEKGEKERVEG